VGVCSWVLVNMRVSKHATAEGGSITRGPGKIEKHSLKQEKERQKHLTDRPTRVREVELWDISLSLLSVLD